jgi:hypothetical protein
MQSNATEKKKKKGLFSFISNFLDSATWMSAWPGQSPGQRSCKADEVSRWKKNKIGFFLNLPLGEKEKSFL